MEVQSSRTVSETGSEKTTVEEEEEEKRRRRPWMKAAQLLEFQMQTMVYRYIAAGLPVPHHLVVPIWNSFALSSWSNHFIRNHHSSSSSSSQLRSKGLYHMDMVDPEPTRCRRTDGKKWRCSSNVVPFQKYCERHMHRGRKRSRKLVESYEVNSSTSGVVSIKRENNDGLESTESQSVLHGTVSSSSNAQVVTIASFAGESGREVVGEAVTCPALVISESTNKSMSYSNRSISNLEIDEAKQKELSTRVRVVPEVEFFPKNVQGDERLPCVRKEWRSPENGPFGRKFFPEQLSRGSEVSGLSLQAAKFSGNRKNGIVARSMEWKNMNVNGGLCPSMHFSPDTVLQGHGGCCVNRVETCNEPGRCRRTDGKKWRCSKDALPGQKYCTKHMHRGIKKRSDEKASSIPVTIAKSGYCKDGDDYVTPQNLKLTVSVLENPISRVSKEMSTSSCSTDTTITDTDLRGEDNEDFSLCSGV